MTTNTEDWDDALDRPDSYPQLAVAAGIGIVAMIGFLAAHLVPFDPLTIIPPVAIGAVLLVGIVWGIGWLLTLRHAGLVWQAGALVVFLVTAGAAFFFWSSATTAAAKIDVERLRQLRVDIAGEPQLPGDRSPGPLSRLGLAYVHDVMAERLRRDVKFAREIRIEGMTDPNTLIAKPELLTDCGRFTRGKAQLDASDRSVAVRAAQFRQALADAIGDATVRATALASFDKAWSASRTEIAEMSGLRKAQLDQLVGMCALLARRHWRSQFYAFAFSSGSDAAEFNRLAPPLNDTMRKQNARRGDTINRINTRLEIAGDTRF